MIAYDSRRSPDPARLLRPETVDVLRSALEEQRRAGNAPVESLAAAIRLAARESRERNLQPEVLIIQLKALADDVGLPALNSGRESRVQAREWMIAACLRAYWDAEPTESE